MNESRRLTVERVRHPLKFRLLEASRVINLTPHLVRVTLTGEDLADFVSASFDDHVKLFFPAPGEEKPPIPEQGPNGSVFPEGKRPVSRDFTPRRYDRAARELDVEFVLGHPGPASQWAATARPGHYLGVGGPRGSFVIPVDFDGHLFIGDDTALPAIARRLEELPEGAKATVIVETPDASGRVSFATKADLTTIWIDREAGEDALNRAVRDFALPSGEGYIWAAGEAASIRAVRRQLVEERGWPKARIRAAAYWRRGDAAVHENFED
jgi:NADPH-dependent ferric siderophore reductase